MDWKKLAERLVSKLRGNPAADVELRAWAKSQDNAALELASDRAGQVLPLVEGPAGLIYKEIVAAAEAAMVEDVLRLLGTGDTQAARDLAREIGGQRRAVGLLELTVRRGAAASLELAERRKTH